jgi:hypothetical protein
VPGGISGGVPGGTIGGVPGGTIGGVPGGTIGGVPGGISGGVPGGIVGGLPGGGAGVGLRVGSLYHGVAGEAPPEDATVGGTAAGWRVTYAFVAVPEPLSVLASCDAHPPTTAASIIAKLVRIM